MASRGDVTVQAFAVPAETTIYNLGIMVGTARVDAITPSIAEVARLAVEEASAGLASDVLMLDIRDVSDFADYFVIATAATDRHLRELAERIESRAKAAGTPRNHREGKPEGGWVLIDFPGFIVHLFTDQTRRYYDLEGLWSAATEVVRIQ